jgi:hypothetical protein
MGESFEYGDGAFLDREFGKTRLIARPLSEEEIAHNVELSAKSMRIFHDYKDCFVRVRIESDIPEDSESIEDDWKVVGVEGAMIIVSKTLENNAKKLIRYIRVEEFVKLNPMK